ncbi:MAG: alpha/beta hydrolase [Lachnospiraceae bacterium]|nr:alpha/beta hydrolase [Lachnospiraceae bacterium]
MMEELFQIDLRSALKQVKLPYRILQGSTDIVASTKSIMEFTKEIKNPYVTCQVIENCGHMPSQKGMDAIMEIINKRKE